MIVLRTSGVSLSASGRNESGNSLQRRSFLLTSADSTLIHHFFPPAFCHISNPIRLSLNFIGKQAGRFEFDKSDFVEDSHLLFTLPLGRDNEAIFLSLGTDISLREFSVLS